MKLRSILLLTLVLTGIEAFALQVSLDNPPSNYRVFSLRGRTLQNQTYAKNFQGFSFDIPEEYIVKSTDGTANLLFSLRNWRRNTPIADGNPRTKNGIGYYPFKDASGRNRYIALEHIYRNRPNVVKVSRTSTATVKEPMIDISAPTVNIGETISTVSTGKFDPAELSRQVEADTSDEIRINLNPEGSELVRSFHPKPRPADLMAGPGIFRDDFVPIKAKFSTSRNTANSYTNSSWKQLSYVQKAEYMGKKYDELLRAHGFRGTYRPETLVCKSYKESTFNPQIRTSSPISTASGVSQVTKTTAADLFSRGRWFQSKVAGFTNIRNGRTFHERMAGSMLAQMELGMAVLEQKRKDNKLSKDPNNINVILQRYFGNKSASANRSYARNILECSNCISKSGYSKKCLDKVY